MLCRLYVGSVECGQAAIDPFVDLGVLYARGLHKGSHLTDGCEQVGFGACEFNRDIVMCSDASVFAYVVDEAVDGFKLLGEGGVIVGV